MGHLKIVLRGKFILLSAYIKNLEKSQTGDLTAHLKALEQKEVNISRSRCQELVKLRAEINKIGRKKAIHRINGTKSWFFKKINKIDKTYSR